MINSNLSFNNIPIVKLEGVNNWNNWKGHIRTIAHGQGIGATIDLKAIDLFTIK
jgi:hypothetical protein